MLSHQMRRSELMSVEYLARASYARLGDLPYEPEVGYMGDNAAS